MLQRNDSAMAEARARFLVSVLASVVRVRLELTRFVSETRSTPWLAIHVPPGGKTLIFFIPRPNP